MIIELQRNAQLIVATPTPEQTGYSLPRLLEIMADHLDQQADQIFELYELLKTYSQPNSDPMAAARSACELSARDLRRRAAFLREHPETERG